MAQLPYEEAIEKARLALENAKRLLAQELSEYPHPISGCDAQYVRLIGDRTRIANSLRSIDQQPFVATPRILEPVD